MSSGDVISGAKWMTISTIVSSIVGILRLSILTRFLDKSDFGIVAVLTLILGLTSMLSDMGFATVIMHKQDMNRRQFSSLFWIQLAVYFVLYFVIICFTKPISLFYNEPLLCYLIPLSLLDLLFIGFGKLYETVLQKNFQFRIIAIRNIVSCILSLLLAILLAFMDCGVYTLVISTLFASAFLSVWNFILGQKHIKLQLCCSVKENIPLIKIGLYQTGTQIVDYLCTKLDVLIIGKFLGMEALGLYNLSKEFIFRFIQIINSIVNKVLTPAFAKIQNEKERMCMTYCYVMRSLTSLTFPVLTIVSIISVQIIEVLYGSGYKDAGLLTAILTLASVGTAVGNPVSNIIIATGRTDLTFKYVWVRSIFTIPCVYFCSLYSIEMVALGQVLLSIIDYYLQWMMEIKPSIGLSFKDLSKSFAKQGGFSLLLGVLGFTVFSRNPFLLNTAIIQVLVYGIIVGVIYLLIMYLFMNSEYSDLVKLVKKTFLVRK